MSDTRFPRGPSNSARIPAVRGDELSPDDYQRLIGVATAAVYEKISPSAVANVADQIVSDTIEQYLQAVDAGKEIHNPFAWVQQRARWRAIDQMRQWQREKNRTRFYDAEEGDEQANAQVTAITGSIRHAAGEHGQTPSTIVTSREWIRELIYGAYPTDTVNRQLAVACLVEGAKPREVTDEFDMSAKVIGNRLVRIRSALLEQLASYEVS